MDNSQEINTEEYLKGKHFLPTNDKSKLYFRIVSNPYKWTENETMILYVNNKVAFVGKFKIADTLYVGTLKENELVHCKLEILKSNRLLIFENKSNFNWGNEYKYLYIGIFPENPTTENIHFFPQKNQVI
jgi:hypothetical protein